MSESAQDTYTAANINRIQIDARHYAVDVIREDRDNVQILLYRSNQPFRDDVYFSETGGTLSLRIPNRSTFFGAFRMLHAYRMEVRLPMDTSKVTLDISSLSGNITLNQGGVYENVSLSNASGDVLVAAELETGTLDIGSISGTVSVDTVNCLNSLYINTTSGSVHVNRATATGDSKISSISGALRVTSLASSGRITLQTTSGTITSGTIEGRSIAATSISGAVSLSAYKGNGKISTTSGSIYLDADTLTGDLTLSSISGAIRCELPSDADVTVHMSSLSGNKNSDFQGAGANRLDASTTSGSIRIARK